MASQLDEPRILGKYALLSSGEAEMSKEPAALARWDLTPISVLKNIGLLCIAFIAGVLSVVLVLNVRAEEREVKITSCGHRAEQARANGCVYEPMQRSWIPPECYFSEPGEEYEDPFSDRKWFLDANLTQPANESILQGLRTGDDITAYTRYFHDEHCLYLWRKLGIANERGMRFLDSKTADLEHTAHCSTYIARKLVEAESGNATFPFKGFPDHSGSPLMFSTCVPRVRIKF